ncbi:MAG: hypothetical protein ABIP97_03085 [Chthoniobacterales bacterium]
MLRRKEVSSVSAHYITGVLAQDMMTSAIDSLSRSASLKVGDRVQTLRGSLRGKIIAILEDGRITWQPDETSTPMTAVPESIISEKM